LVVRGSAAAMHSVSKAVSAKNWSQSSRHILFGRWSLSWSHKLSEGSNCVVLNQLHASDDIALHEGSQIAKEGLSLMLLIELLCLLGACELAHLQFWNIETVFVDGVNNLASLSVTVRLDHAKGLLAWRLELSAGKQISVLH
jgi:hypothetical protein